METTIERVLPFWNDTICPSVLENKNVIVVAHGNSLRAVVKHLTGMSEPDIIAYNIPTACPLVFEFDENIYDSTLTINFIEKIRDEQKFESLDALKKQLIKDKEICKRNLSLKGWN